VSDATTRRVVPHQVVQRQAVLRQGSSVLARSTTLLCRPAVAGRALANPRNVAAPPKVAVVRKLGIASVKVAAATTGAPIGTTIVPVVAAPAEPTSYPAASYVFSLRASAHSCLKHFINCRGAAYEA
jgi:hypothetical protein